MSNFDPNENNQNPADQAQTSQPSDQNTDTVNTGADSAQSGTQYNGQNAWGNAQNPYQNNPYNYQNPYQNGNPYWQGQPQNGYQTNGYQNNGYQTQNQNGSQPDNKKKKKAMPVGGFVAIILAVALVFGSFGYFGARLSAKTANSHKNTQSEEAADNNGGNSAQSDTSSAASDSSENSSLLTINNQDLEPMTLTVDSTPAASMTIPEVVEKTADSVVEITTEVVATSSYMQQYVTSGAGSGVIVSENGYIVTNNHVIEDATSITVTLHNGDEYDAELVGLDEEQDIALLKIDAEGLTPATIGDSDGLVVGQTIIVIGNPLGQLGGSVTSGIISATERTITIENNAMTLLQIDAAVNPGNSGGALFNEAGELVGIVNAKSSGDDIEGIGFAIPINDVTEILDDLLNYGYVKGRAAFGVTMVDITSSQMAFMYNVNELGTYIYSITEGGAADKAGLQVGDRIVSVNGTEVSSYEEVKAALSGVSVGDVIEVVVSRNSQQLTIDVTMGEYVPSGILSRVNGSSN